MRGIRIRQRVMFRTAMLTFSMLSFGCQRAETGTSATSRPTGTSTISRGIQTGTTSTISTSETSRDAGVGKVRDAGIACDVESVSRWQIEMVLRSRQYGGGKLCDSPDIDLDHLEEKVNSVNGLNYYQALAEVILRERDDSFAGLSTPARMKKIEECVKEIRIKKRKVVAWFKRYCQRRGDGTSCLQDKADLSKFPPKPIPSGVPANPQVEDRCSFLAEGQEGYEECAKK